MSKAKTVSRESNATIVSSTVLPDVALENSNSFSALSLVGMQGIEVPILIQGMRVPGKASAMVSLDQQSARGIHMSRLFSDLQQTLTSTELSKDLLKNLLQLFLKSHQELSQNAFLEIEFQAMLSRQSLKSENTGWRNYPVRITAEQKRDQAAEIFVEVLVTYSSTCPASAALSRQLIQENFKKHFQTKSEKLTSQTKSEKINSQTTSEKTTSHAESEKTSGQVDFETVYQFLGTTNGIIATPHAQRSLAQVKVQLADLAELSFAELIDVIEEVLQTPVQTMVKRQDEQEFALRNGQNLMFCEDAARKIGQTLSGKTWIADFVAQVKHLESLHPHDAVAIITAGKKLHTLKELASNAEK